MFGDNGLINQAQQAKDYSSNSTESDYEAMNRLYEEYANVMSEDSKMPIFTSEIEKAKETGTVFQDKTTLEDKYGNKITIPGGFKVAEDSGDTVQEGIVIEDVSASTDENVQGSQYVWIPVGRFTKSDGTKSVNIVLGRYTFDDTDGTPHLEQAAYTEENETNYTNEVVIEVNYEYTGEPRYREHVEVLDYRDGESNGTESLNATAKDLAGFVESVKSNGGYYIARYEASYASGAENETEVGNYSNCKAASKISIICLEDSMIYNPGTLWNYMTQVASSKVAINTYADSTSVKSDLINSYAWDTAIVYIQEAGNSNYANQYGQTINSNLSNTGVIGDEVCKINDMAGNIREWTTEYTTRVDDSRHCAARGGCYRFSNYYVAGRNNNDADTSYNSVTTGFRLILYM